MTSDDRFPDMADIDAELERLLSGGAPSAEAPAWFGDVAVLVRTARAPARPDELAGEEDIVARMVELRLAVLADASAEDSTESPAAGQDASGSELDGGSEDDGGSEIDGDGDEADAPAPTLGGPRVNGHVNGVSPVRKLNGVNGHVNGVNGHVNGTAASAASAAAVGDQTTGSQAGAGDTGGEEKAAAIAARGPGGPTAREPMEERLRERMSLAELDEYRAKHGGERYYVAKHSAPAAEEPPHAVARTVGRVIAMKAVAITTAAALGVAAAAAATTGIVANVVVPAFNEHFQHPVPTSEPPDSKADDDDEGSGRGSHRSSATTETSVVVTDPVTGATLVAPSTTAQDSSSTSVPADTTTTSTTSTTTSTSEPDPPTTATPTTVSPDPQSLNP